MLLDRIRLRTPQINEPHCFRQGDHQLKSWSWRIKLPKKTHQVQLSAMYSGGISMYQFQSQTQLIETPLLYYKEGHGRMLLGFHQFTNRLPTRFALSLLYLTFPFLRRLLYFAFPLFPATFEPNLTSLGSILKLGSVASSATSPFPELLYCL